MTLFIAALAATIGAIVGIVITKHAHRVEREHLLDLVGEAQAEYDLLEQDVINAIVWLATAPDNPRKFNCAQRIEFKQMRAQLSKVFR